jgi:hypothetical protein
MSVRVQAMGFEVGPQDMAQHSMMIALADNADDEGVGWPGDDYLAQKSRMSVRNLVRVREQLELDGWIAVSRRARVMRDGKLVNGNLYQMNMPRLETAAALARKARQEAKEAKISRRDTVSCGNAKRTANATTSEKRHDMVSCEAATCHPEQGHMTNTLPPHDMTLADVVLNQADAFYNRNRTIIEPNTPPKSPASGGPVVSIAGEEVHFSDGGVVMGPEFLECALLGNEAARDSEKAESIREALSRGVQDGTKCAAQIVWQVTRVMRECGWTQDARLERAIGDALELFCSTERCDAAKAADLAIENVKAFIRDRGLMRHGCNWTTFFKKAYWRDSRIWPYDGSALKELRAQAKSAVGMYQPGKAAGDEMVGWKRQWEQERKGGQA